MEEIIRNIFSNIENIEVVNFNDIEHCFGENVTKIGLRKGHFDSFSQAPENIGEFDILITYDDNKIELFTKPNNEDIRNQIIKILSNYLKQFSIKSSNEPRSDFRLSWDTLAKTENY